jgi:hypothetical protein
MKLMKLMKVNVVHNHADYRLCSNRVLKALAEFGEVNLFLRGIIPSIGFKSEVVYYDRLVFVFLKIITQLKRFQHLKYSKHVILLLNNF